MDSMMNAIRGIKMWQVAVLLVILAAVVGGVYGGYVLATRGKGTGLAENQQAVPVQRGTLTNDISINGSLVYPEKETLTFGVKGTVGEVLVTEGQAVEEGQVLAALDTASRASLEKAVSQASLALKDAEEALAKAKAPSDLDIAQAEASVSNAKLSLQSAQDALTRLLSPTAEDIAKAESSIANARASLQTAQKALDTIKAGATDKDLAKAQSQLDSANVGLVNAQRDLQLAKRDWDAKVKTAQDTLTTDLEAYKAVFRKWLGIDLTDQESASDPESLLNAWGADLEVLFDSSLRFEGFMKAWNSQILADDPVTHWNEITVYTWLNFYLGSFVPTCDGQTLSNQTVCIYKEMDDAWNKVQASVDNKDDVDAQATKAIASAENAVTTAQDKVESAQEALSDLKADPDLLEVDVKACQVKVAEASLANVQYALNKLLSPDQVEVDAKQKAVEVARLKLADAEKALAELKAEADPFEVSIREADVTAAQTALELAQQQLESVTLRSPMKGVVQSVSISRGDTVDAKTSVMVVADRSVIEVSGTVDEIDVLFVKKGAVATVTMDALSGQTLNGTVSSISAEARTQYGVVSYPISIRVTLPDSIQLVEGLSAVATVVISEEDGLLIPLQSVYGTYQQPLVRVLSGNSIEIRSVSVGNSDDFWTIVKSGLSEGEKVVMEVSSSSTSSTFFRTGQMGGFEAIGGIGTFPGGTGRIPGQR